MSGSSNRARPRPGPRTGFWRPDGGRGFTLLEALIAFTILAVALAALLLAFGAGVGGLARAEAYGAAALHARSKLEEVGRALPVELGIREGEFDDGYRWRVDIGTYDGGEPDTSTKAFLYTVNVSVGRDEAPLVTLRTLRLAGPPESGAGQ